MRQACPSWSSCLQVVPEETTEWNPLIAPQAMVTNIMGQSGPAAGQSAGRNPVVAAAVRWGAVTSVPARPSTMVRKRTKEDR